MPTPHEDLVALMTAPGAAHLRAFEQSGQLTLAMIGREWALIPGAIVTRGPLSATVYGSDRTGDVLCLADDGAVYATSQAFTTGAEPLCALTDTRARETIAQHLAAVLSSRTLQ